MMVKPIFCYGNKSLYFRHYIIYSEVQDNTTMCTQESTSLAGSILTCFNVHF